MRGLWEVGLVGVVWQLVVVVVLVVEVCLNGGMVRDLLLLWRLLMRQHVRSMTHRCRVHSADRIHLYCFPVRVHRATGALERAVRVGVVERSGVGRLREGRGCERCKM